MNFAVLPTLYLLCVVPAHCSRVSYSLRLKRKYSLPCLHHSTWTFLMASLKPSGKISLLASLLHFSLGSLALLLVKKSSYPIMSGAMLEWSPCLYLPHITCFFFPDLSVSFSPFFASHINVRSLWLSHTMFLCQVHVSFLRQDSVSRCLSLSFRWV